MGAEELAMLGLVYAGDKPATSMGNLQRGTIAHVFRQPAEREQYLR